MADKKPRGWGAFDELARRIAAVPKEAVEAAIKKAKKRRRRKKK